MSTAFKSPFNKEQFPCLQHIKVSTSRLLVATNLYHHFVYFVVNYVCYTLDLESCRQNMCSCVFCVNIPVWILGECLAKPNIDSLIIFLILDLNPTLLPVDQRMFFEFRNWHLNHAPTNIVTHWNCCYYKWTCLVKLVIIRTLL